MTQLLFPRATLKRIIKYHENIPLTKKVVIMVYLDFVLFLQRLAEEANTEACQDLSEKTLEERHIIATLEQRPFNGHQFNHELAIKICHGLCLEFLSGTPNCYIKLVKQYINIDPEKRSNAMIRVQQD
ncbi:hypothetical protein C2G38_2255816 [Gigaspora rosea]|uniref:Transcription factor CBF/NF-Y/archaeal histone domain-containing protein n=1 Tax=Gigaspora rosea TaxID=44941 RepID=A0A397TW38_9GLOM|nr:hypothetical protein C2G38_2255816 [Gigaspora rosea]